MHLKMYLVLHVVILEQMFSLVQNYTSIVAMITDTKFRRNPFVDGGVIACIRTQGHGEANSR
jgi:hypothetical protein